VTDGPLREVFVPAAHGGAIDVHPGELLSIIDLTEAGSPRSDWSSAAHPIRNRPIGFPIVHELTSRVQFRAAGRP